MPILADIASLEDRIDAILARLPDDLAPTHRRFQRSVVEAVLATLDEFDLDALRDLDLDRLITDALAQSFNDLGTDLSQAIATRVQEIIRDTAQFYNDQGIDPSGVLDAVMRSESAQRLGQALEDGMSLHRTTLQDATVEAMRSAIASGTIDRDALADDIATRAEVSRHLADTQVTTSVAAYNQTYRNELASQAELSHFFYYGSLIANSRPFCRACAGKTFTDAQIEQMDNSMLNPVKTFRGGWNCRHSWLPVDPAWDDELGGGLVDLDETQEIALDDGGKRSIRVFLNTAQASRLREQVTLSRVGYDQYFDAEDNDRGYVAVHPSWRELRRTQRLDGPAYRTLADEFDVASILAARGDLMQLNPNIRNTRGGASDLIWNGQITELKTLEVFGHRNPDRRISHNADQGDVFIFNLRQSLDDHPRAVGRLQSWLRRHPNKSIFILHRYDNDRLEEVTNG